MNIEFKAGINYEPRIRNGIECVKRLTIEIPIVGNETARYITESGLHGFMEKTMDFGGKFHATLCTDQALNAHVLVVVPADRRSTLTLHSGTDNIGRLVFGYLLGFNDARKSLVEDVCAAMSVNVDGY